MPELLPCPFCGEPAEVSKIPKGFQYAGDYIVGCTSDCMCMGYKNHFSMVFCTEESAINKWNTRAPAERGEDNV